VLLLHRGCLVKPPLGADYPGEILENNRITVKNLHMVSVLLGGLAGKLAD
jgi:hypothetical protein